MPALDTQGFVTRDPGVYAGSIVGTAAATGTIQQGPTFLKGILINSRVATGTIVVYNSVGTSASVIGSIVMGTQTFGDPPPLYEFDLGLNVGLTVTNSANMGAVVIYK